MLAMIMLLTAAGAAAQPDTQPAAGGAVVRVMSFNIRYGKAPDGENHWEKRRELVFEVIRRHRPDLVGLQEALRFQIDEIRAALPMYGEIGVARDDGEGKGEFNTILYRRSLLRPAEQGNFWYSETPEKPGSKSWGNRLPRLCTWARFVAADDPGSRSAAAGSAGGANLPPFYYYNTHWDHESQPSRVRSAELLVRRISERRRPDPVIVSGDMNAGEANPAVLYLLGKRSWPTSGPSGKQRTPLFDTYRRLYPGELEVGTFNGFKGRTSGEKIDYIAASAGVEVIAAEILRDNRDGRYPSDHYPLLSILRLPQAAE